MQQNTLVVLVYMVTHTIYHQQLVWLALVWRQEHVLRALLLADLDRRFRLEGSDVYSCDWFLVLRQVAYKHLSNTVEVKVVLFLNLSLLLHVLLKLSHLVVVVYLTLLYRVSLFCLMHVLQVLHFLLGRLSCLLLGHKIELLFLFENVSLVLVRCDWICLSKARVYNSF